mmetsp:Transcript_32782/g.32006  ORF Transcript_32782/g.32006 Transcript_32782/m.32006 type:complete len:106 (-) Transcript_32782:1089-1406(-)
MKTRNLGLLYQTQRSSIRQRVHVDQNPLLKSKNGLDMKYLNPVLDSTNSCSSLHLRQEQSSYQERQINSILKKLGLKYFHTGKKIYKRTDIYELLKLVYDRDEIY